MHIRLSWPLPRALALAACVVLIPALWVGSRRARQNQVNEELERALVEGRTEDALACLEAGAALDGAPGDVDTPLASAAGRGDLVLVRELLKRGAAVDRAGPSGITALLRTCERNQPDVARLLLRHGADVEQRTSRGWTPLLLAAQNGRAEMLAVLLEAGARIDRAGRGGRTALMLAAGRASYRSVRVLLEHGAKVHQSDDEGRTPLLYGAGVELPEWGGDGLPALTPRVQTVIRGLPVEVSEADRVVTIRELARAGADANQHDRRGRTPLGMSLEREETRVAKAIYAVGGRCATAEGFPSLVVHAALGQRENVARDVAAGSPVDVPDRNEMTPLLRAVVADDPELARWLLAHGAAVNQVAAPGGTALHRSIGAGHRAIAELLLGAGADRDARDAGGWTPLAVAAVRGDRELAGLLLDRGASASARNIGGRTLLYPAAIGGPDMVRYLLERGPELRPGGRLAGELPAFLDWCRRSRILDGGRADQIRLVVDSFSGVFTSP